MNFRRCKPRPGSKKFVALLATCMILAFCFSFNGCAKSERGKMVQLNSVNSVALDAGYEMLLAGQITTAQAEQLLKLSDALTDIEKAWRTEFNRQIAAGINEPNKLAIFQAQITAATTSLNGYLAELQTQALAKKAASKK